MVGYGESLGALGASVNIVFELSFQNISRFAAGNENRNSHRIVVERGKDIDIFVARDCADVEKIGFIPAVVFHACDGELGHAQRVSEGPTNDKNFLHFFSEKKIAHFLLLLDRYNLLIFKELWQRGRASAVSP
ncbi:MAG: hypothetical protein EBS31_04900 [Burkholderiaceae bacterium]|nr:hypothetical protein [Burkholderiaceae bacterium]